VCTICTELLDHLREVSALRCGHLFHAECLATWLSQSMTCPQCRQKVTRANIIHKLFFSRPDADDSVLGEPGTALELSRVASKLEEVQNKLCLRDREMAKLLAEKSAVDDKATELTESYRLFVFRCVSVYSFQESDKFTGHLLCCILMLRRA